MSAFLAWLRAAPLPSVPFRKPEWAAPEYPLNKIARRVQIVNAHIPLTKSLVTNPDAQNGDLRRRVAALPDRALYLRGLELYHERHSTMGGISGGIALVGILPMCDLYPHPTAMGIWLFLIGHSVYHFWQFGRVANILLYLEEH